MRRYITRKSVFFFAGMLLAACSLDAISSEYQSNPGVFPEGGPGDIPDGGEEEDADLGQEEPCTYIDPATLFCETFAGGLGAWTLGKERGGDVTVVDDQGLHSARVTIPAATKRPGGVAYLMKEFSETARTFRVVATIAAPENIGSTLQPVLTIEDSNGGKVVRTSLAISTTENRVKQREVYADGGGATTDYRLPVRMQTGYANVDLTLTLGTRPHLAINFDGTVLDPIDLNIPMPTGSGIKVYFGTQEAEIPTGAWHVDFDDINVIIE